MSADNDNITDITPEHSPVSLAKSMLEESHNAVCGFYALVDENDEMTYNAAGMQRKDVLWALIKLQNILMKTDEE